MATDYMNPIDELICKKNPEEPGWVHPCDAPPPEEPEEDEDDDWDDEDEDWDDENEEDWDDEVDDCP